MRSSRLARKITGFNRALIVSALIVCAPATASANSKYAGIVVDAKTGKTLYASKADAYRYPASLTKIMTLYVLFEEMEAGRYSLNSRLKVSKYAAGRPPTKLGLKAGGTIKVKDAILGLITKSANDASTVIAENISGSEKNFAERMTRTARQLGMSKTTFKNPHGLPNSAQRTTARDMATLGRAIQERFPQYYGYFKTRSFKYKGRTFGNHNRLLGRVKGVDGIKTGYTRASGFNLTSSVQRNGRHIVAVVMGGKTGARRNAHMADLIRRYLPKASKGKRTAPLIASRTPAFSFDAASLKNPPRPTQKPGQTIAPAVGAPIVLASSVVPAEAPVKVVTPPKTRSAIPGFGNQVPLPPKAVKSRFNDTFAVATALPPVPRESPDAPLTTQSISKTALLQAARARAGAELPVRTDEQAPNAPLPVRSVKTEVIEVLPASVVENTPAQAVASAPVPTVTASLNTTSSDEVLGQGDADEGDLDTNTKPVSISGWQVQIAAAETQEQALTLLEKAKSKAGRTLRGSDLHTEQVEANGQTLYRARFVGFDNKAAARKACRSLKKAKFACFAIYQ